MRVRIKATGFKDWDTMAYNNIISIPILLFMSIVTEGWTADNFSKNLCVHVLRELSTARLTSAFCFPALPSQERSSSAP